MQQKKIILIVDDDPDLRSALAEQLDLHEDFRTEQAESAASAFERAQQGALDLIILDADLPDMDGREACVLMRKSGIRTPIIMLVAADSRPDSILDLDSGASDYVAKPFKFSVLLTRLRAHLRSHELSEDAVFPVGPYEFRPAAKLLLDIEGRKIRLTEKEANILKYLHKAGDKPVPREELLREVWGYNAAVSTHTLETHVYRLRQKIEIDPQNAQLLLTDLGGYKLQP